MKYKVLSNDALVKAFDASAASKGIKHRIEDEIRREFNCSL